MTDGGGDVGAFMAACSLDGIGTILVSGTLAFNFV